MLKLHITRDGRSWLGRKLYKTRLSSTTNAEHIALARMTRSGVARLVIRVGEQAVFTGQSVNYSGVLFIEQARR
jgi:hypothetical protein